MTRERMKWLGRERRLIYLTLVRTGLRYSELRSITIGQVLFDTPTPHIVLHARDEKNRKGAMLPLRRDLADEIREYLSDRRALRTDDSPLDGHEGGKFTVIENRLFRFLIPGSVFMLLLVLLLFVYPGPEIGILKWILSEDKGLGVLGLAGGIVFVVVGFLCSELSMAVWKIEEGEILAEHLEKQGYDINQLWKEIKRKDWPRKKAQMLLKKIPHSEGATYFDHVIAVLGNNNLSRKRYIRFRDTYESIAQKYPKKDQLAVLTDFVRAYYAQKALELWVHRDMANDTYGELKQYLQRGWSRILIAKNSMIAAALAFAVWAGLCLAWIATSYLTIAMFCTTLAYKGILATISVLCVGIVCYSLFNIASRAVISRKELFEVYFEPEPKSDIAGMCPIEIEKP